MYRWRNIVLCLLLLGMVVPALAVTPSFSFAPSSSADLSACEPHSYLETTQGDWMQGEHSAVDVRSLDALGTPYAYDDDPRGSVRLRSRPGTWTKYEGNPILLPGPAGNWDDYEAGACAVVRVGEGYEAWYTGTEGSKDGPRRIGRATSSDGINWTKDGSNPVVDLGPAGAWDDGWVLHAQVLYDGAQYRMWYGGSLADDDRVRIGYATSSDGVNWSKYADNPILDVGPAGAWDDHRIFASWVLFDGAAYRMWYNGRRPSHSTTMRLGYAVSPDGLTWTKYEDNPVLLPGPVGSWDAVCVQGAVVLYDGTGFQMWYSGRDSAAHFRIGYATSTDGIHWVKDPDNPVLDIGPSGSWDDHWIKSYNVIFDGSAYRMWYHAKRQGAGRRVGYAEAPPMYDAEGSYTSSLAETGAGAGQQVVWQWLWIQQQLNGQSITYDLLDEAGDPIPGFTGLTVPDGGGGLDISDLSAEYTAVYLRANLSTTDPAVSPVLEEWEVQWCLEEDGELPPTSLEVGIAIEEVLWHGGSATISGTISAQNDVENPAYVNGVHYGLEYRLREGGDLAAEWIPLQRGDVAGPRIIEPGGLALWPYEVTFTVVPGANAYRITGYVELENHPGGPHVFLARRTFNPPTMDTGPDRVLLPELGKETP